MSSQKKYFVYGQSQGISSYIQHIYVDHDRVVLDWIYFSLFLLYFFFLCRTWFSDTFFMCCYVWICKEKFCVQKETLKIFFITSCSILFLCIFVNCCCYFSLSYITFITSLSEPIYESTKKTLKMVFCILFTFFILL